jgi:hypothetical protein
LAAFNKYQAFIEKVFELGHDLQNDTFKLALTNTAPAATDTTWSTGTYPAPGIGPFRYEVIYNSTRSNIVVGYYDYGSSITLANAGDTYTSDFDATNGVIQAS